MFDTTKRWPCEIAPGGSIERAAQDEQKGGDLVIHSGKLKLSLTARQHRRKHEALLERYKQIFKNHPLRRGAASCQAEITKLKYELKNARQANATLERKLHDKTGEAYRLPQVEAELKKLQRRVEQMERADAERKQQQIKALKEADEKVFEADAAKLRASFVQVIGQETPILKGKAEKVAEILFQAKRWDGKSPIYIDSRRVYTALVHLKRVTVESLRIEEKNGGTYVGLPVPDRVGRQSSDEVKGGMTIIMPGQEGGFESSSDKSAKEKAEEEIARMNGEIGQAIIEVRQARKTSTRSTSHVRYLTTPEAS